MKKIIALLCIGTLLLTATVILTSHIDAVNSGTYNNPPYQPSNPDPQKAWDLGCTFMAMNYNFEDTHLREYRRAFKKSPIVIKA